MQYMYTELIEQKIVNVNTNLSTIYKNNIYMNLGYLNSLIKIVTYIVQDMHIFFIGRYFLNTPS